MGYNKKTLVVSVIMTILALLGAVIGLLVFSGKPTEKKLSVADSVVQPQGSKQSLNASEDVVSALTLEDRWAALIVEFSTGDYVQQYIKGVRQEASIYGLNLEIMDAKNDRSNMARMIDDVTLRNFDGIMISHGSPESISQSIERALRQGISVAAAHCDIPNSDVIKVDQDETQIANLILKKIIEDTGGKANLAMIWVPGFEPMEKRMEVYIRVMNEYPGLQEVNRFGDVTDNTSLYAEIAMETVLKAHPAGTIDLVFATWDEFAQGAARAIMRAGRKEIHLYGVDISNEDLKMLQNPNNPWVATAAVDAKMVGRVQVRLLVQAILGNKIPERYLLQPVLITKSMLPNDVQVTMAELHRYVPGWGDDQVSQINLR